MRVPVVEDRGLLLDYGGVLTRPVGESFAAFEEAHGIEPGRSFEVLVAASRTPGGGLIGALERGEVTAQEFERELTRLLREAGYDPPDEPLLAGLFDAVRPAGGLWDVAARARGAGVRTGLLSNSWGTDMYPWDRIEACFDVRVISGEVGLRKPDPRIYRLACDRLGVDPAACAFVDDLERNVEVARELGMFGVVHRGDEREVIDALAGFLDVDLSVDAGTT